MSLPTYYKFINGWSLVEKLKFHYDVDLDNFTGDVWDLVANVASNRDWLNEFYRDFEENLREREYIR